MNCVECNETITNPVCPECLAEGVKQWLHDERHETLLREIDGITSGAIGLPGETFCVCCGKSMALCAYCYTKDVFEIVKKYPTMLRAYLEYFNFDLGHLGWEKEARIVLGDA